MQSVKNELLQALQGELDRLWPQQRVVAAFESPKQAEHGDLACTTCLQLARPLKANPRQLAQQLQEALLATVAFRRWVAAVEIAGPGFLNLRLTPEAKQQTVREVLAQGERYGHQPDTGQPVIVEFVSANPTGPLHVGHGRQAALGDAICNLLASQGWRVHREFYYNDAGVQIENLALSVQARAKGLAPDDAGWPEDGYRGDYIADVARAFLDRGSVQVEGQEIRASGDADDLDAIRRFAVAYLRNEQNGDLAAFGVAQFEDRRFGTLSEGERKRVQIARALMTDPELLLLDEPAAGLDVAGREALVATLTELALDPYAPASVLVTHHVEEIPVGITHALLLKQGAIVAAGPLRDTLTSANLSETFDLPLTLSEQVGRWTVRAV